MQSLVLVIHVLACLAIIGLVLIQHGKGADAGAAFGSGASGTIFGAQGTGTFLSKTTAIFATTFFVTSLLLGYLAVKQYKPSSLSDLIPVKSAAPVEQSGSNDIPRIPE